MRSIFLVLALLPIALIAASAHAQTAPQDRFDRAERADEALSFAEALALYDEARALAPASPRAARAEARAASLRAHAEDDFRPLVALERVRRDPAANAAVIDGLVRAAETYPPGLVRLEVWILAADAYAHRLDRPVAAEALLARVLADPRADRLTAATAAADLVELTVARGDLAAATRAAGDDPVLARRVTRRQRRRYVHDASMAALGALVVLAGLALVRTRRAILARGSWLALAYGAYLALAGALLANGYERGTAAPFVWLGVVLVPLLLLVRAWAAAGSASRPARLGRAALAATSALGAAFLVLEQIDATYLAGVGL